jgi:hypothetical protein
MIQWIRQIHLNQTGTVDLIHSDRLNPTLHDGDPNEPVPANHRQPRVGFQFKQKFKLEFEI